MTPKIISKIANKILTKMVVTSEPKDSDANKERKLSSSSSISTITTKASSSRSKAPTTKDAKSTDGISDIVNFITKATPATPIASGPVRNPIITQPPPTLPKPLKARASRPAHQERKPRKTITAPPTRLRPEEHAAITNRVSDLLSTIYYHQELISQTLRPIAECAAETASQILWCMTSLDFQPSQSAMGCAAPKLAAGTYANEALARIKAQDEELNNVWQEIMLFHHDEYLRERVAVEWIGLCEEKVVGMLRKFGREVWGLLGRGSLAALVGLRVREDVFAVYLGEMWEGKERDFVEIILFWGRKMEASKRTEEVKADG